MSSQIKAAGYIIYNEEAIWGVGCDIVGAGNDQHYAWMDAIAFMDHHGDWNAIEDLDASIQKYIDEGFSAGEATQELIDMVKERGGAIGWDEVNGIHCTEKQKHEYEESLLKVTT